MANQADVFLARDCAGSGSAPADQTSSAVGAAPRDWRIRARHNKMPSTVSITPSAMTVYPMMTLHLVP
jgi:hypothetical protein